MQDDGWTVVKSRRAHQQDQQKATQASASGLLTEPLTQLPPPKTTPSAPSKRAKPVTNNTTADHPPVPAYFRQSYHLSERGIPQKKLISVLNAKADCNRPRAPKPRLKVEMPIHCLVPHVFDKPQAKPRRKRLNRSLRSYSVRSFRKVSKPSLSNESCKKYTVTPPLNGPPPRGRVKHVDSSSYRSSLLSTMDQDRKRNSYGVSSRAGKSKSGIADNFFRSQIKWSNYRRSSIGMLGCTVGASSRRSADGAGGSS